MNAPFDLAKRLGFGSQKCYICLYQTGMKSGLLFLGLFLGMLQWGFAQSDLSKLGPQEEKKFGPYMATRHGGFEGLEKFKAEKKFDYLKELWYFSSSFTVKRKHFAEGLTLDESTIDISRFEYLRKPYESVIVEFPGYSDVLVLLPKEKMIYTPEFIQK